MTNIKITNNKYEKQGHLLWIALASSSNCWVFSQFHPGAGATWNTILILFVQSPDLTHPSEGFLPEGDVWHDILSVFIQLTMIRKHFQKIFPNVDLRLEGAGRDWSHHSGLGCLPPPGSTESTRNSRPTQNWIEKLIYKFQPWPNLRLTYLALRGRLPFSLFNSRWSKYCQNILPLWYCQNILQSKYLDVDEMRGKYIWNIWMRRKWEARWANMNWPYLMGLHL